MPRKEKAQRSGYQRAWAARNRARRVAQQRAYVARLSPNRKPGGQRSKPRNKQRGNKRPAVSFMLTRRRRQPRRSVPTDVR